MVSFVPKGKLAMPSKINRERGEIQHHPAKNGTYHRGVAKHLMIRQVRVSCYRVKERGGGNAYCGYSSD
jgi:hypothetical protein